MVGGTLFETVSLKANCNKLEVGLNLGPGTGSPGFDRSTQTTSLFLGMGHDGALGG